MATIATLVTMARAAALARQYQQLKSAAIPTPSAPPDRSNQATVESLSTSGFTSELEKHLTDYRQGYPELSKKTAGKIQQYDDQTNTLLSQISPKALRDYGAYGTFLSYEKRARYISNVYASARDISALKKSFESA